MAKEAILITGACGEVGQGLVNALANDFSGQVVALDLKDEAPKLYELAGEQLEFHYLKGDILDKEQLQKLFKDYKFSTVFHLAALLSTAAERNPMQAHAVNIEGSLNLINLSQTNSKELGRPVRFMFPSSIAVYGLNGAEGIKVQEDQYLNPITLYGIHKLHIEALGRYYSDNVLEEHGRIDFRSVRYPGLLSADTVPSGGTSDYGPEMLHAAAQNKPYASFVPEKAKLPFMVMPDAVRALLELWQADSKRLKRRSYNVGAFAVRASQLAAAVKERFPAAKISYEPDTYRSAIVRSWPGDVNDIAARNDWGWKEVYTLNEALGDYLLPGIERKYNLK